MTFRQRQLRAHFDLFIDRDARYPGYVLTDEAWRAFLKSESHGKGRLTATELELAAPLFDAKWGYEITLQSLWQEMAEWWSNGWGWVWPIRHTILAGFWGPHHGCAVASRVHLRALFKIYRSIHERGFGPSLRAYTGLDERTKNTYFARWNDNIEAHVRVV